MKKLLLIPIILMALLLIGCSWVQPVIPEPVEEELSANVVIVDWEQECSECEEKVKIYYKITNTGTIVIDYYEIWFDITCEDGTLFRDLIIGVGVSVGGYDFDKFKANVDSKEVIRVEVVDWELTHWGF